MSDNWNCCPKADQLEHARDRASALIKSLPAMCRRHGSRGRPVILPPCDASAAQRTPSSRVVRSATCTTHHCGT